ncbi:hypothetical protein HJG60_012031 [Phyllostomus discolor]|uniref:Uncharacterized protein n=1 Tax=Phyllostomus discolor TaxID=89673 RepID=A0A833ZPC1_9CHIR|nr:hypothetical protein HJG60_012031 [Phyllostomus discolor]
MSESSGQDGGTPRNALLPCTTKRRITTNLKTINKQKDQTIKLHGTPTTKELKKQSPRPVGGAKVGSQVGRTHSKMVDCESKAGLAEWGSQRLKASCKVLQGLPQQRKLPVSHERVHWKVGLELSK